MANETDTKQRKPRSPLSIDDKLTALRDAKRTALTRLSERLTRKRTELTALEVEHANAERELERLEAALGDELKEAAQ